LADYFLGLEKLEFEKDEKDFYPFLKTELLLYTSSLNDSLLFPVYNILYRIRMS